MKTGSAKVREISKSTILGASSVRLFSQQPLKTQKDNMPISKKDRIHREHKKAEAAGTRVPVNPNGTPKKAPKPTSICVFCKKELVRRSS